MSQIVLSDKEVQKIGASRWLKKQAKSFMVFWYHYRGIFTLVFWGAYERIFGKPSRLAGIAFLKEYRQ